MTPDQLQKITNENVVIIEFVKKTDNRLRLMTCTTCLPLLQSQEGFMYLHYKIPKGKAPYDPQPDNLIVWDIIKQDFRQIPANRVRIKQTIHWLDYLKMIRGK